MKRALVIVLLLAGCGGQEVADESPTAFDDNQNMELTSIVGRLDKIEARQKILEVQMLNQPEPKPEPTGTEILLDGIEKRKLERRVEALESHQ